MSTDITTTSTSTSLVKRAGLIALFAVLALLMGAKFSGALISGPASSGHSSTAAYNNPLTAPGVPGAPSVASAKDATGAATGDIIVTWNNPSSTGVAITSYTVVDVSSGAIFCTSTGTGAAGDTNNCKYTPPFAYNGALEVYANGGGQSTASGSPVTLSVPAAPASVTVTLKGGNVAWALPTDSTSNALSVLGYYVYANGNVVCTTTALTCAPTGLTVGNSYTFTVAARNAAGVGATYSGGSYTYAAAPAAPTNVSATVNYTTGKVLLSWAASASTGTGGGTVTYSVSSPTAVALTCDAVTGSSTSCNIPFSVLVSANGAALPFNGAFTVTATNLQSLTASGTSNAVTISPVLSPATSVVVTNTGSTMTVTSWNAPTTTADGVAIGSGANVITGYSLQLMTASAATPAATVTFTPVGSPVFVTSTSYATGFTMTSGNIYTVAVTAVNASGASVPAYGQTSGSVYFSYTGSAPGVTGTPKLSGVSNSSLTATWTAPTTTNGLAVTGYSVQLVINGSNTSPASVASVKVVSGTTLSYTYTGLTAGTDYAVQVSAINSVGTGNAATSTDTTLNGAPAGVTLTYTATGATISWTAAAASAAVTSFVVQDSTKGTALCTVSGTASSCSLTSADLAAKTAAGDAIHVYSLDANGVASAKDGGSVVTVKPSAVTNTVAYSSTLGGIYVAWDAMTNATSYNIVGISSLGTNLSATSSTAKYTFPASALAAGATYTFQVNATNATGSSIYASPATVNAYVAPSDPGVPTAVGASKGTALTWTWTYAAGSTVPAATSFLGTLTPTTGAVQTCSVPVATLSCTFSGLTIGMSYKFTVQTIAPLGNSAATAAAAAVVTAGVAGPVTGLTAIPDAATPGTTLNLKWTASTIYTTAITGYTVSLKDATGAAVALTSPIGGTCASAIAATAVDCTITGLTPGSAYTVSVVSTATLLNGSANAATSTATTATATMAAVPSAVAKPTATVAGDTAVKIAWTAPASNGSPITKYTITASAAVFTSTSAVDCATPSGEVVTYTSSTVIYATGTDTSITCTLSGTSATTFTVSATNAAGNSASNVASASFTAITAPLASNVTAVYAGSPTLGYTLGWTDTNTGTAAAVSYTVTVLGGAAPIVLTGITTKNTVVPASSLQVGLTYAFTVTAVNAQGSSTAVNATLGAVPATPAALTLYNLGASALTQTQSTLIWTASASPNGMPITYNVYATNAGVVTLIGSTTTTSLTFSATSATYSSTGYSVTPVNARGAGTAISSLTNTYSYVAVPTKPTTLSATPVALDPTTPTATGATLLWTPDATSGQTPLAYTVVVTGASGPVTCTVSLASHNCTIAMGALTYGAAYTYTVTETTPFGTSTAAAGSFAVAGAAPTAPTSVSAVLGTNGTSATITWGAPTSVNGSPLTGYLVTTTGTPVSGASTTYTCAAVLTAASTSCTISGLAAAYTYTVSVQALNVNGASTAGTYVITGKAYAFKTPAAAAAPDAPTNVTIAYSTVGSLTISWTAGAAVNASPVTSYLVTATGATSGTTATCTSTAPTTTCTLNGLNNEVYGVVVTAQNGYVASPTTSAGSVNSTAYTAPNNAAVIQAVVSGLQGSLTVVWSAPVVTAGAANAAPLTAYNVTATDASGNAFSCAAVTGTATTCTIVGLANATSYTVSVTPVNAVGTGTVSATSTGKTLTQTTSPAPVITTVTSTQTGLTVSWTAPTVPAGAGKLVGYMVSATDSLTGQQSTCPYNATYGVLLAPAVSCSINGLVVNDSYTISVTAVSMGASGGPILGAAGTKAVVYTAVVPEPAIVTFLAITAKQKSVSALSGTAKTALNTLIGVTNDGAKVTVTGYGTTKAIALARANAAANYLFSNGAAVHITVNTAISKTVKTALVTVTSN